MALFHSQTLRHMISISYCMVCEYVLEDYPRALASGLSTIHTHTTIQ